MAIQDKVFLAGAHVDPTYTVRREPVFVVAINCGQAGLGPVCRNPFQSILVRSVEILYACDEALRLIASYEPPEPPAVALVPRAVPSYGCPEAPRGILYHRYDLDHAGTILDAKIVPPTSQNQKRIEQDLTHFVAQSLPLLCSVRPVCWSLAWAMPAGVMMRWDWWWPSVYKRTPSTG